MTCLFFIEDFECESTDADKCFDALTMRIRASATPVEERKYFDSCAGWIYKKDTYRGAEAQALIHQQREKEKEELSNEITLFSRDLPSFVYETWQSFVQKKREHISTFRLCRYLKERWNRLEPKEKSETIPHMERIIDLLKNTYPEKKDDLHRSLKKIISNIRTIKLESRGDEIKKEIRTHKRAKRWEDLNNYILNLNTAGFSHDLIMLLTEEQRIAEEGLQWFQGKQRLDDLVKKSAEENLASFQREFLEIKEEIPELVGNQSDFGGEESKQEIEQLSAQFYLNILTAIKNSKQSAEAKFRQLKLWEENLRVFKHNEPDDWDEYKGELSFEMAKVYADNILKTSKTPENIDEIKQAIDKTVKEINAFDLKEKIKDYIAEGKIADIFEIQGNIKELLEFDRSLEKIIAASDPFTIKPTISAQPDDFQGILETMENQVVLGKLTEKYQAVEDIIRFTTTTTDQLDLLVVSIQKESKNILFNNPNIKLEGFERQFEAIRDKTTQVLEKYKIICNFKFLENLEKITAIVYGLLFPSRSAQQSAKTRNLSKYRFIKSINEKIANGEAFYNELKQLKTKIDDHVMEAPIVVQDKFFEVIAVFKDRAFVFPKPMVKKVCTLYTRLMEMMRMKIDSYLNPLKARLNFPFPLIEKDVLDELREKSGSLLKQMDKIDLSYPGFEEFVEVYKDELEQWNRVIEIQEVVREGQFDGAVKSIEADIYDPDIRYPLQILVYYHRYLSQSKGKEDEWLNFFSRFSLDSIKMNETGYRVILKHYRKDIRKNFGKLALSSIESHHKVFKALYPNDELMPYLLYLSHQYTAREFFKKIENRPVPAEVFKGLVNMLEKNEDWKRYIALYNHSPKKCQRYFEKPVEKVKKNLGTNYNELVKIFEAGDLETVDIDAYVDKIPEGREFLTYFGKSKKIKDISDSYLEITRNFKSLENENIWMLDDLYARLFQSLGRHTDKFTDEFANIRNTSNWSKRIASLKNIYDQGRKLKEQLDDMVKMDLNYTVRAEENYSKKLRNSIQELLNTWTKFNSEIGMLKENAIYKETFQDYYLKGFMEKWKKMSLYPLCINEGIEPPANLDDYFKMWETILETHNEFLTYYNNMKKSKKKLHPEDLDKIKVLDEFIRLSIERLKQQSKL